MARYSFATPKAQYLFAMADFEEEKMKEEASKGKPRGTGRLALPLQIPTMVMAFGQELATRRQQLVEAEY